MSSPRWFKSLTVLVCTISFASGLMPASSVRADGELMWSSYSGSLVRPAQGADESDGDILRRFEASLFHSSGSAFFVVSDDARSGCPWPDSFGRTGATAATDGVQPHLVYDYDGTTYVIPLPPLIVALPEQIADDVEWEQHGWLLRAVSRKPIDGQPAWIIEASERRGRRQELTVDAATGVTLTAEADVFMGQGDQFRLAISRTAVQPLDQTTSTQLTDLQKELTTIQAELKRRPDGYQRELSERQIADASSHLDKLTLWSADTPLKSLVTQITSDLTQQSMRLATAADRAGKLMGTPAPEFVLALAGGGSLTGSALADKTVILHFWDYRDAPLSEPYGQTGYLEFLFNQKKAQNVHVVGISTNPELQTTEHRTRGLRSIRKLTEFMNLSYPIGFDDGTLLKSFGDPRDARGQLPVWVVLSPGGKVAHYHAGFYEVDAAQGLKQLEAVLAEVAATKTP